MSQLCVQLHGTRIMPRQKQSKPKALKQQREEVEQLIRDGGPSDPKKQDEDPSIKTSRPTTAPLPFEKHKHKKGRKQHRSRNTVKVKIAKVRSKHMTKVLQAKELPVNEKSEVKEDTQSQTSNNNDKSFAESTCKELKSVDLMADVGLETPCDKFTEADKFKDKYDMIKERSLKRATKVKQTIQDKGKERDSEDIPKKVTESPKKTPVSPVKDSEGLKQESPEKTESSPMQYQLKQSDSQRKFSEKEIGRLPSQNSSNYAQKAAKGRQRSVSEGMLHVTPQESLSKQQALEALLQITGVEFNTMSKTPSSEQRTPSQKMTAVTNLASFAPRSLLTGLNLNNSTAGTISEADKDFMNYHMPSNSLEEQGLKLVYTTHAMGNTSQDQINYSSFRSRTNSTMSNASDSTDDPTAKDSQKLCKKLGRHVCQFCGRRCTKPSVLKKHIRSHTGERPYPCAPCGFSFKTKSNLYKHCKTNAHAIKAGPTPNSDDLSKLTSADLEEDDSEETESEDEVTCDTTVCLTERCLHQDYDGPLPYSELEDKLAKQAYIPAMQVPGSLSAVPVIPRQLVDSQRNKEIISRHSSNGVYSQSPVLSMEMPIPRTCILLPNRSSISSEILSSSRPSSAPSAPLVEFPKSTSTQQAKHLKTDASKDEEVVLSASGASSNQLLKSILPGELAGFRIDMETRRAIPVLNPQLGTSGAPSTTQSEEGASSQHGQLLIPFTGFNIVKSGGQYHVQIPVQGIPEDSLTMSLDSEAGCSADDSGSSSSHAKGISKESLQERIQLLISQNRAIVDNTVLEAVKPRRTSASRRDSENNSPRVESSSDHINDGKIMERQWANPSSFSDFGNLSKHKKDSLSEAKPTPPSRSPMAAYPWPSEGNLLERVLKSQQQNPLLGIASTEKHVINPLIDPKTAKLHLSTIQTGPSSDNSNSIKDLLMQDRPHRLAQIAQHSPVHVYADSPGGRGSPGMRFFPGVSWPYFPMGDSAVSQLRGALQQRPGLEMQGPVYAASHNIAEDVNISQRISELRGTGRRRKYKSESDAFDVMPSGPSSPKRKARKIKDIPTALSPLAANIQHQETNMTSCRPTETQRGTDLKSASIPHAFASYPGQIPSQQTSFRSPTAHHMTYRNALTSESVSLPGQLNMSSPGQMHSSQNIKSLQRHLSPFPSHVTPVQHSLSPLTSMPHQLTMAQGHLAHYPRPVMSGQHHMPTLSGNLPSNSVFQCGYPPRGTSTELFAQSTRSSTRNSGVHSQTLPALSEVSVIQHTRTQSKDEIINKELKLEVSQARVDESRPSVWPYQHPLPVPIQHASPSSQGPHLLAVASRSSDLSSDASNRKPSFSTAEEMQAAKKHDQQLKPLWPGDVTTNKQQKSDHEAVNATPIAMQLLAAVANSSSYSPKLSPRRPKDDHITGETDVGSWSLPNVPKRSNGPVTRINIPGSHMVASSRVSHKQDVKVIPEKELKDRGSPELKKVKMEGSSVHGNPKSPRSDSRAPVSNSSGQSLTTCSLPRVPASRRHLTLDLKSPLTSRVKSPGASESPKPALQIDPKSLLTPEALSIAESVMKLASPMKTNTPITPVESARELGRLMAHAFHNAGGKVESLITSTQGTMMIGPIATPTPGSGSGSTQYFIIPSPSTSQPPSGFPGPNSLFSPSASTASSSLISPLRSPAATRVTTSQVQSTQQCVTTDQSLRFKRVPPQKPDCLGTFEKHILRHVKTNSPLKRRIIYSKLSRSMARNSEITQTTSCCVKRPQPMYVKQGNNRKISMYSNWRPGGTCPNPLGISWKSHIALYDSGRNKKPKFYYVNTSISPPQGGIYSDSAVSQTAPDKTLAEAQHQSDVSTCTSESSVPGSTLDNSLLETRALKLKERRLKDASEQSEPNRIQIFTGGFKSNENYVYVRGRGRGKYVCEECGIRCKKPSMLKKHIRTHTDMRPYQCQICNFAFKTKGNLTKHVKSKAHSKKCIKSGIPVDDQSCMEHQFSDADDEDTDSADGDTTDEDDEDEDDDISETHSESAVPVAGAVPHRERYSSVPNIQDMPDSFDGQGRPLVWHEYHPGHVKKGQSGLQDGPRRDSIGSITTSNSSKAEASIHDDSEDKQPVKLSRLEVVGKLSRHLTNRHQQSLEKAQKASALTKTAEDKVEDGSRLFEISQLPLFHSSLLPQAINPARLPLATESKNIAQPPAPPILDKYGHIVLTMSRASSSQYRLSTTVQNNLSSRSKVGGTNPSMTVIPSPSASMQASSNSGIELWTYQPGTVTPTAGMLPSQSKSEKTGTASNLTTSETLPIKDHVPSFVRAPSYTTASVRQPNSHATSVDFQPQQESVQIPTATVSPGASNLVVGVYPMHTLSNRQIQEMFPPYAVAREAKTMGLAKSGIHQTNTGEFLQQQRNVFFPTSQDPLKSSALPTPDPDKQVLTHSLTFQTKAQLSPWGHSSRFAPYSTSTSTKGIPPPIIVEVISDDEDEHGPRKQKLDPLHHNIRVSGSIRSSANSSTPSWMSEPGSAIKQLLLARQPLIPPSQDVSKPIFFSQFLPPSLVSPKSTKSSPNLTLSSPFQPLVSPMIPSKMMQLPPTILSQVRSPTVQSSNFSLKEELRKSPEPFVPPVARGKSQFQMTPPQSRVVDKQGCEDQPPVEVAEELVASPTQIGNHRCPNCSKVFMKPSQLRIHMRIHLEEDPFSCPECSLSYPTRLLLAKHERSEEHLSKVDAVELPSASNESDPRPFKCKECQIAFRIPGHLAKHLRSRGHRMTLEREGKLLIPREPISPGISQGDLVIDDSHRPSSPAGSSDKTDSASEGEDASHMEAISRA